MVDLLQIASKFYLKNKIIVRFNNTRQQRPY